MHALIYEHNLQVVSQTDRQTEAYTDGRRTIQKSHVRETIAPCLPFSLSCCLSLAPTLPTPLSLSHSLTHSLSLSLSLSVCLWPVVVEEPNGTMIMQQNLMGPSRRGGATPAPLNLNR
jgi:hypothetical protein